MNTEEYATKQIEQDMEPNFPKPEVGPTRTAASWLAEKSDPVDFTGDNTGMQDAHLQGVHDMKRGMGTGSARSGLMDNPDDAFNNLITNNRAYNPLLDFEAKNEFRKMLSPAARQSLDTQVQDKNRVTQQNITPEMDQLRGELPDEIKPEFDTRLAQERLDNLFPPPVDPSQTDFTNLPQNYNSDYLQRNPTATAQVSRDTGVMPTDNVSQKAPPQQADPTVFGPGSSQSFRNFVNNGGDPNDSASQERGKQFNEALKDQEMSRLHFLGQQNKILRDGPLAKTYNGLSDTGKVAFIKHQDALDAISGRSAGYGKRHGETDGRGNTGPDTLTDEGKRMEALRGIESRVSAGEFSYDDLAKHDVFSPEKEGQALNLENLNGMVDGIARDKQDAEDAQVEADRTRKQGFEDADRARGASERAAKAKKEEDWANQPDKIQVGGATYNKVPSKDGGYYAAEKVAGETVEDGVFSSDFSNAFNVVENGRITQKSKEDYYRDSTGRVAKKQEFVTDDDKEIKYKAPPKGAVEWSPIQDQAEQLIRSGEFDGEFLEALNHAMNGDTDPEQARVILNIINSQKK